MRIKISAGTEIILEREVPDDPRLAEFDKHRKKLLDMLRNEYERGPKSKTFDADKAWLSLRGHARFLGWRSVKQATIPAADRRERLRDIAKILRRANRLVERTMQNVVGSDLFLAWWEVRGSEYAKPDGRFDPRYMERKFNQLVKGLADLENAASYGADHVEPPERGKPPVLTGDDIWNLAVLYRDSTGSIPGAGDGPFAEFVWNVLIAVGRPNDIKYGSMVEAIKGTRRRARMDPVTRKRSPFDEEL
jgi:hypothetical protein